MTVFIALLRGVNVGGSRSIKMQALRDVCAQQALEGATTYLQSGNVVFRADRADVDALARALETAIGRALGVQATVLLRTLDDLRRVIVRNPFPEHVDEPSRLLVTFLAETPTPDAVEALRRAHTGPEAFEVLGRELYVYYPNGAGRSKLSSTLIEKKLRAAGTARNWNTVTQLESLGASLEAPQSSAS